MGYRDRFVTAALVAGLLAASLASSAPAGEKTAPAAGKAENGCFACHDSIFAVKPLENDEKLPLFVDREAFAASVHADKGCGACHDDVVQGPHPSGRAIPSRRAFSARRSAVCRTCHKAAEGAEGTVHAYLVRKTNAPPCSVCHTPHKVRPVREWRAETSVTRYCLACHFFDIQVPFPSDEDVIPAAGGATVWSAMHLTHQCTDCHTGFSKEKHPARSFATRREHAERLAEGCRTCHPKQYRLAAGSVHSALPKSTAGQAPICTDCHGSHDIAPRAAFEVLAGVPCRKCHEGIFSAFGSSVHGQALASPGHTTAPLCSDCHHAHGVASLGLREQMSRACQGCHADTRNRHARWLPSAELHLQSVTCPACHVPRARRRVDITFYDQRRKQPVSLEEVRELLGPELARRLDQMEDGNESIGVWALLRELNRRGAADHRTFVAQLDAPSGVEAHRIGDKAAALRECAECHQADREKLERMFLK